MSLAIRLSWRRPAPRTWREWRLLVRAIVWLAVAVVATRMTPYRLWRRWSFDAGRPAAANGTTAMTVSEIVRAVNAASTIVPFGDNCLARAMAGRAIFARYGVPADVTLGVARGPNGELRAHAWLRHDGRFVLGDRGIDGFVPLPDVSQPL